MSESRRSQSIAVLYASIYGIWLVNFAYNVTALYREVAEYTFEADHGLVYTTPLTPDDLKTFVILAALRGAWICFSFVAAVIYFVLAVIRFRESLETEEHTAEPKLSGSNEADTRTTTE